MILDTLEALEKQSRAEANVYSYTHAIGWSGLFNGFGGEKKSLPTDLLPFKDESDGIGSKKISDSTRQILLKAINYNLISDSVAAEFSKLLN